MRKLWLKLTRSKKIKQNTRRMCWGFELPVSQNEKNSTVNFEIFFFTSLMLETDRDLKGLNDSGLVLWVRTTAWSRYHCLHNSSYAAQAWHRQRQKQKPVRCRGLSLDHLPWCACHCLS